MHNIKYYLSGTGRIIGRLARGIGRCGSCDGPRNHTALVSPAASSSSSSWSSSSCLGSSCSSCSRSYSSCSRSSSSSSSAAAAAVKSGGVLSLLLLLVLPWSPPPVLPPLVLPGPRPQRLLDPSETLDPLLHWTPQEPLALHHYSCTRRSGNQSCPRLAFRINNPLSKPRGFTFRTVSSFLMLLPK